MPLLEFARQQPESSACDHLVDAKRMSESRPAQAQCSTDFWEGGVFGQQLLHAPIC